MVREKHLNSRNLTLVEDGKQAKQITQSMFGFALNL
jgi:hypothetical protein